MNAPVKRIGKYEVIEILGRGGMGLVYRAFDRQLNREVAIKTVTEGFAGDAEMLQRFYREAAKTGALKHPNIVIVHDLGEQDGFPYIVMEYLSGDPLDRIIQSGKPLPLVAKLKIIEQVCYALGYAHRNDVIHRDVKPANVIVQPDGVVKLLDFGIARQEKGDGHLTRTGHVIGTIQYMAPERLKSAPFDGRSDIFSVGVMMFELLTGQLPFTGDYSIVQKILSQKQAPLSNFIDKYPPVLDSILERALAKDPNDRYSTADEMAAEISSVAQDLRKEQVAEWIQGAERLVQREDYTAARDVLLQVLKVDSQHTGARQLIAQVQQSLNLRQRAEQVRKLKSQAEEAIDEKRYEEALHFLEEALGLDPSSAELSELVDQVRQKKRQKELIEKYLRESETARDRGDLEVAGVVIAKALEIDKEDSRVRAAHVALARLIEETARQAKVRQLLEGARQEIVARHFTAAMEGLAEVERVDPSNPELLRLQTAARSGREQEMRRRALEKIQNEVSLASTVEELTRAMQLTDQALQQMQSEPVLLKLKGHLMRRLKEEDLRRRIDEVALRCRDLIANSPQEALKVVEETLQLVPGNERLLALHASILGHMSERSQDRIRAHYLTRAHEALSREEYAEAVDLLESCQKEGLFSPEIAEMIEFARQEDTRRKKSSQIERLVRQAQEMMSRGSYGEVVELLSPWQSEAESSSLTFILADARRRFEAGRREIEAVFQTVTTLKDAEQYSEAVKFLESQSPATLQAEPLQNCLNEMRQAANAESDGLLAVANAYAMLESPEAQERVELIASDNEGSPLLARMVPALAARRKALADRRLTFAIAQAQASFDTGDRKRAAQLLEGTQNFVQFASSDLQDKWHVLGQQAGKKKNVLGRLRSR